MMTRKLLSLLIALLMITVMALPLSAGCEESYTGEEALDEEYELNVYTPEAGDYEWYMLPAELDEGHAYLDIYPAEETVMPVDGTWTCTFTLQEVNGHSFTPTCLIVIKFSEDVEVSRDVYDRTAIKEIMGKIPAEGSVIYQCTVTEADITAVALSVIGVDADDYEMEFHSINFLGK